MLETLNEQARINAPGAKSAVGVVHFKEARKGINRG
jgi:hypothetical protein